MKVIGYFLLIFAVMALYGGINNHEFVSKPVTWWVGYLGAAGCMIVGGVYIIRNPQKKIDDLKAAASNGPKIADVQKTIETQQHEIDQLRNELDELKNKVGH